MSKKNRNYTQSSLTIKPSYNGNGIQIVLLTYKKVRYKLYWSESQFEKYIQEKEQKTTERKIRKLCKVQGTKQKLNETYGKNIKVWEDEK